MLRNLIIFFQLRKWTAKQQHGGDENDINNKMSLCLLLLHVSLLIAFCACCQVSFKSAQTLHQLPNPMDLSNLTESIANHLPSLASSNGGQRHLVSEVWLLQWWTIDYCESLTPIVVWRVDNECRLHFSRSSVSICSVIKTFFGVLSDW